MAGNYLENMVGYKCDSCGRVFDPPVALRRHTETAHARDADADEEQNVGGYS